MYRMNDSSDVAIHGGAIATLISSIIGLSTMEKMYLAIAIAGALISLLGYLDKRKTENLNRRLSQERLILDQQRSKAIIDFLQGSPTHDISQAGEVVQKVNQVLVETEQDDNGNLTAAEKQTD